MLRDLVILAIGVAFGLMLGWLLFVPADDAADNDNDIVEGDDE